MTIAILSKTKLCNVRFQNFALSAGQQIVYKIKYFYEEKTHLNIKS